MRLPDRKEAEVRGLLEGGPPPPVPPDLAVRAELRGIRLLHRRRTLHLVLWAFFAAAVAFGVWAAVAEPWAAQPALTTPPVGW
ncbi:MAG: hypothetical protein ACRDP3_12325 [Streptomyces sp.]|uniref:hypothetical protein n=1 Tax=Streptomyces sp. TaxID=1931 RepID=UPI003D6C03AF